MPAVHDAIEVVRLIEHAQRLAGRDPAIQVRIPAQHALAVDEQQDAHQQAKRSAEQQQDVERLAEHADQQGNCSFHCFSLHE